MWVTAKSLPVLRFEVHIGLRHNHDGLLAEKSQRLSPLITEHDRGVAAAKCISDSCL